MATSIVMRALALSTYGDRYNRTVKMAIACL